MEKQKLLEILLLGICCGEISVEDADTVLNLFDERVSSSFIPDTYAEAIDGMRFDGMNYPRHGER